jgi:hypothetical protein
VATGALAGCRGEGASDDRSRCGGEVHGECGQEHRPGVGYLNTSDIEGEHDHTSRPQRALAQ